MFLQKPTQCLCGCELYQTAYALAFVEREMIGIPQTIRLMVRLTLASTSTKKQQKKTQEAAIFL